MEFDKNKILTCVTAGQLKEGQLGWINDCVDWLKSDIQNISPYKVFSTNKNIIDFPFTSEDRGIRRYFYPAPEPTYKERQTEWLKETGLKVGDKVKIVRKANDHENGWGTVWATLMNKYVGKTGVIDDVDFECGIHVIVTSLGWWYPYFVLEPVKETYRSFNNDELNDLVGEVLTNKQSGRRKLVTGKPTASEGVNLDGSYITAKDLLASFYRNGDEPCGVKEEA